jgi:hypothetical protein
VYFDATTSVMLERFMVWVVASAQHCSPSTVLRGFFSITALTVPELYFCSMNATSLYAVATTRFRVFRAQRVPRNGELVSTRALTAPPSFAANICAAA